MPILPRMCKLLALLVAFAVVGGCAAPSLTGAWRSQVQFASGDFAAVKDLEFLYVFNEGGTMTESSNYDSAPPGPPAYGVWRAVDARRYEAVYTFFMIKPLERTEQVIAGWMPMGRGEIRERIELAADGRSFRSTMVLQIFDPAGQPLPGAAEGVGNASRIGF